MQAKLFVGNLTWNVTDAQLEELFRDYGQVQSAQVVMDRDSGRSRGFGFVEIEAPDIDAVIQALNGSDLDGRALRIDRAENKPASRGPRRERY
jgi:RNA recognition motif-containing protein